MELELNKIYNEDCNIGLSELGSEVIDLVLNDAPYNISKDNNFKTMGRNGIDFGEWDKGFDDIGYLSELHRVCKKGANVVTFTDWKRLSYIVEGLESSGFIVKDMIRMVKSNPMPRNRDRRYVVDYEVAIWAVKKGSWTFNRQSDTYDIPCINTTVTSRKEKVITNHPTQKSVKAIEELMKTLSNAGDVVLDCFMGSGTTAIAALNLNRNYIGFELNEDYYYKSLDRINLHKQQLTKTNT